MSRILILALFLFSGCASLKDSFIPSKPQEAYIQATRKTEILKEDTVEFVLIITHLNSFSSEYLRENGEVFFVDIYSNSKGDFFSSYKLSLNSGDKPLKITKLKKEELSGQMLENATSWGEYYIVEFAPQERRIQNALQIILSDFSGSEIGFLNFGFKPLSKQDLRSR